jgi:hypothetical protein
MRAQGGARRFHLVDALIAGARAVPAVWAGAWGVLIYLAAVTGAGALLRPEGAAGWVQTGAAVLGALAAWGAANRIVIFGQEARHQGLGPAGLQFRGAEIAMIAAAVLNLIFLAMIVALLALVALALFGMAELDVAAIQAQRSAQNSRRPGRCCVSIAWIRFRREEMGSRSASTAFPASNQEATVSNCAGQSAAATCAATAASGPIRSGDRQARCRSTSASGDSAAG